MVENVPCLLNNSPGVLIDVELNITSSLVLTEGLNPSGVCACAMPTKAAKRTEDDMYMVWICSSMMMNNTMYNVED
jgi:hypothetical protein